MRRVVGARALDRQRNAPPKPQNVNETSGRLMVNIGCVVGGGGGALGGPIGAGACGRVEAGGA